MYNSLTMAESTRGVLSRLLQQVATDRISGYRVISKVGPAKADKEQALAEVLASQAFARSEQLKNFLRYVCELEIADRAAEIKEYSIGTMALGRSSSYTPAADSSVRRRAFELRAKLEELYQTELAGSMVRIEIPKGSYVPTFLRRENLVVEPLPEPPLPEIHIPVEPAPPPQKPRGGQWIALAAALLSGLLLGALGMRFFGEPASSPSTLIVREAWGPLGSPQGNVLISIASGLQMTVRAGAFSADSDLPSFPAPAEIYSLYQKTSPWDPGDKLFMRPSLNTASLGVVGAVAAAATSLHSMGAQYQILPERIAPLASFRNRNVILIGDPLNSFAAAKLFHRARLTIAHDPATNRLVMRDREKPASAPPAFSRFEGLPGKTAEVYGLLTVLPSDAEPSQERRTLIVSGVSNVGIHGAMEFFASGEHLQDLKKRMRMEGLSAFPKAYQVVVRCTAENSLPLSCGYAAHYVLEP